MEGAEFIYQILRAVPLAVDAFRDADYDGGLLLLFGGRGRDEGRLRRGFTAGRHLEEKGAEGAEVRGEWDARGDYGCLEGRAFRRRRRACWASGGRVFWGDGGRGRGR